MSADCLATISLANYRDNLTYLRTKLEKSTKILAVIKANAYGHGLVQIAHAASEAGCSHLGVASVSEVAKLRKANISTPILLLRIPNIDSFPDILLHNVAVPITSLTAAKALANHTQHNGKQALVHIALDTDMHREGCSPSELLEIAQFVSSQPSLELEGLYTHLAESESIDTSFTEQQLDTFDAAIKLLHDHDIHPPLIHAANSAAIITTPRSHYSMVRPGLATYGINPLPQDHPTFANAHSGLKPVMSITTRIAQIKAIAAGEPVGYNRTWHAKRDTTLALLPIGYADGLRRWPYPARHVLINNEACPIVGTVSMDQISVDITDLSSEISVDTRATILGGDLSADLLADWYKTIPYDVVTHLPARVLREYV